MINGTHLFCPYITKYAQGLSASITFFKGAASSIRGQGVDCTFSTRPMLPRSRGLWHRVTPSWLGLAPASSKDGAGSSCHLLWHEHGLLELNFCQPQTFSRRCFYPRYLQKIIKANIFQSSEDITFPANYNTCSILSLASVRQVCFKQYLLKGCSRTVGTQNMNSSAIYHKRRDFLQVCF